MFTVSHNFWNLHALEKRTGTNRILQSSQKILVLNNLAAMISESLILYLSDYKNTDSTNWFRFILVFRAVIMILIIHELSGRYKQSKNIKHTNIWHKPWVLVSLDLLSSLPVQIVAEIEHDRLLTVFVQSFKHLYLLFITVRIKKAWTLLFNFDTVKPQEE